MEGGVGEALILDVNVVRVMFGENKRSENGGVVVLEMDEVVVEGGGRGEVHQFEVGEGGFVRRAWW